MKDISIIPKVPMLGAGPLFLINRDKPRMLAAEDRRRAFFYIGAIIIGAAVAAWFAIFA